MLTGALLYCNIFTTNAQNFNGVQTDWSFLLNPTTNTDVGIDINRTSDNGFIMASTKKPSSSSISNTDLLINRLDSKGNILWSTTWGGGNEEVVGEIFQTSDGGYIFGGSTASYGSGQRDMMLLKLNSSGGVVWQKYYGSSGDESGYTMKILSDGGYILAGTRVIRTDANGNVIWSVNSVTGGNIRSIIQTSDGGFAMVTQGGTTIAKLHKMNSSGTILWSQSIFAQYANNTEPEEIQETPSGDLVICGEGYDGTWAIWGAFIYKTNSTGGVIFNRTHYNDGWGAMCNVHGTWAYDFAQTTDGGYLMVGGSATGNPTQTGTANIYIKVDANGNLSSPFLTATIYPNTWLFQNSPQNDRYQNLYGMCIANECGDSYVAIGYNEAAGSNDLNIQVHKFYDTDLNGGIPYDFINTDITANTTWSSNKSVAGTITVKAPNKLTINNNMFLKMGLCGGIIVEKGAKLEVLSNATITSLPTVSTSMWKGIQVWGDRTLTQTTTNQGYLTMNTGTIENARLGVTLSKAGDGWNYNGGVIQASNATFRNNRKCVEFMSYHRPTGSDYNISYFNNCTFTCTGPLRDPGYGTAAGTGDFVSLWDVSRVNFRGCTFSNTGSFTRTNRGRGIYSEEASYNLYSLGSGTSLDKNQFTGLYRGVEARTLTNALSKNVSVNKSVFTNTPHGISGNIGFSSIAGNTFNVASTFGFGLSNWGAFMENAKGFNITSDNAFIGSGGTNQNYGVYAQNPSTFGGRVSDNDFSGLYIGNQTEQSTPVYTFSCNRFNYNSAAVVVNAGSGNFPNQGTGCGSGQVRAGNEFVGNGTDIYSGASNTWTYYAWGFPASTVPVNYSGVNVVNCNSTTTDYATCPMDCTNPPCAVLMERKLADMSDPKEREEILSSLIRYHLGNDNEDAAIRLLEAEKTVEAKKILIPTYIERKEFDKARRMMTEIPSYNQENISYLEYHRVLLDVKSSGKSVFEVDAAKEQTIRSVANSGTETASNAKSWLSLVRGEQITYTPEEMPSPAARMAMSTNSSEAVIRDEARLSDNYPNPFSESTVITAYLPGTETEGKVVVYNTLGETVRTYMLSAKENTINISKGELKNGIYFYTLIVNDKNISTKKMIVLQ